MVKAARWVEILIGAFFLVSAGVKAIDMGQFAVQVSAYNVVKDPTLVRASAYFAVVLETVLGAALLAGIRWGGLTHLVSAGMIAVYSGLIFYAWQYHGLEDCGCLGAWITMGPVESLAKNLILVVAIAFSWWGTRGLSASAAPAPAAGDEPTALPKSSERSTLPKAVAMFGVVLVVFLGALDMARNRPDESTLVTTGEKDIERPFAQFVFTADGVDYDLGEGEYLVAMLNATCSHCKASVPALNELFETEGMPEMVALMMGTEAEYAAFQAETVPLFSGQLIEMLTFMEHIGTAPPRLIHIRDGAVIQYWDWEDDVPVDQITSEVAGAAS